VHLGGKPLKNKPKARFIILSTVALALMVLLVVSLYRLTIVQGEELAESAQKSNVKTISTTGARGRILDRNGIVLAYDETSYNVQFYRDPERRDSVSSALYTDALIQAIDIIEAGGGEVIDTFFIHQDEMGNCYYDWGVQSESGKASRYKNFRNAMGFRKEDISADEAYASLRKSWCIPDDMPFEQARKIMSVRQEVLLNNWRAYESVTIAYDVSIQVVAQLDALKLMGINTQQSTSRVYPQGNTACHIIGYLGRQVTEEMVDEGYSYNDYVGVAGIESTMEKELTACLSDRRGKESVEVNRHYTIIRKLDSQPPKDGNDVMLTVDIELQKVAEEALEDLITTIHERQQAELDARWDDKYSKLRENKEDIHLAETGSIVVLDVDTGDTLAIASYPNFDPNEFIEGISETRAQELFGEDSNNPMLNRAIQSSGAPGSTFKMATGLAGLMEGVVTLDEKISDESPYYYFVDDPDTKVTQNAPRCWVGDYSKHADLTVTSALGYSCNYYFFTVADRLGISRLGQWSSRLGLDSKTGIELPGELRGQIGGQAVLYDNTKSLSEQRSSLPRLYYNAIASYLKEILSSRGMEYDQKTVEECALHLLQLQDGTGRQLGGDIRRVLREDLGIPEGITRGHVWVSNISSYLDQLRWKPTQTIRTGMGQGVMLVTPLELCRYVAAIGSQGTVHNVHVVDSIIDGTGTTLSSTEPEVFDQLDVPQEYWDAILAGMGSVVSDEDGGTAAGAISEKFRTGGYADRILGKTGSAQTSAYNNVDLENTSWLVMLTPKEDPEIAIVINVPYGWSGASSMPAAEAIVKFYLDRKDSAAPENLYHINGLTA